MSKKTNFTYEDWLLSEENTGDFNYQQYIKTHFELMMEAKPKLLKNADGILLFSATSEIHRSAIGIHLSNPSSREIEDAIERAQSQGFPAIWIHGAIPKLD